MQLEINEESVCFLFLPHPLPPTFPFSILNFHFSIFTFLIPFRISSFTSADTFQ